MFRVCLLIVLSFADGFSAINCEFDVKLEQCLGNSGFHRNLSYKIVFDNNVNSNLHENCYVGLNVALPAGVYVNPDELSDLRRVEKVNAIPRNLVNTELPAKSSQSSNVYIFGKLSDGESSIWLPIHARYHHARAKGGLVGNYIHNPKLYLSCRDGRLDKCDGAAPVKTFICNATFKERCFWRQLLYTKVTETLVLDVPVGDTSSYLLVTVMTALFIICGSFHLLRMLHLYKKKIKNR